jgi:hypothetical protein
VLGGLGAWARQGVVDPPRRPWSDGLHLGVLLIGLVNLGTVAIMQPPPWTALVAVGAVATLRGHARTALVTTAAAALIVARPLLRLPAIDLPGPWWLPGYGDWSAVARYALPALLLAVLARPGAARLRPHSWWWRPRSTCRPVCCSPPSACLAAPSAHGCSPTGWCWPG